MASTAGHAHERHADDVHSVVSLLRDALVGIVDVSTAERLSGGASRETWRLIADGRPVIAQLQRADDGRDMLVEASVVSAAAAAGVPVPELLASGRRSLSGESATSGQSSVERAFMILAAVDGETIARKILRDDRFAEARRNFAAQCGTALARIHEVDVDAVGALEQTDQIEQYTNVLDELGQPRPTFELVRRWLLAHRPADVRPCLVHGDFRLGNLIVGPDGLRAVIDWELAHLGDPMEDLGWLCVKAWRFGGSAPVGGIGDRADLFAAYEQASGRPVDPNVVRWWEVLGTWKWGIMCVLQAHTHRSGAVRSHELAAIGRRVCENEFDLLDPNGIDLFGLGGDGGTTAVVDEVADSTRSFDAGPHAVPTAPELIEAVREWIDSAVVSGVDGNTGRLRYDGRVASNVLAMVERELVLGPEQAAQHRVRLERLGVDSDRELATEIRAGRFDGRTTELAVSLLDTAVDELRVANPRYVSGAR